MKPSILALLAVLPIQLTTTKGFIDCRTACRKCREGFEEVSILEIYCSMCKECRDSRRERMSQQHRISASSTDSPSKPDDQPTIQMTLSPTPHLARMEILETRGKRSLEAAYAQELMLYELKMMKREKQQQKLSKTAESGLYVPRISKVQRMKSNSLYVANLKPLVARVDEDEYMATWPEHCPTPPYCSEGDEIVKLTRPRPTTTTTSTPEPTTCPPVETCRIKKTTPSCVPCSPNCDTPCSAQRPLLPKEININIIWKGKVPTEFIGGSVEMDKVKHVKIMKPSLVEIPGDWIEVQPDPVTRHEIPNLFTIFSHTQATTVPETVLITPEIIAPPPPSPPPPPPPPPPALPTATAVTCTLQPLPGNENTNLNLIPNIFLSLPLAVQAQLSHLGENSNQQITYISPKLNTNNKDTLNSNAKITIDTSTATDIPQQIVLDEALIRKILMSGDLNTNIGNGLINGVPNNNGNKNGGLYVSEGPYYNGNNNGGINCNEAMNREPGYNGDLNNVGIHNQGVINYAENSNHNNNENYQKLNYPNNRVSNLNTNQNSGGPNCDVYKSASSYNQNSKGGPSNIEYNHQHQSNNIVGINANPRYKNDELEQKNINENPCNDKNLHTQKAINKDQYKDTDKVDTNEEAGTRDKTKPKDQDYYYVYVGVPKNLVKANDLRRGATPVDLTAIRQQIAIS